MLSSHSFLTRINISDANASPATDRSKNSLPDLAFEPLVLVVGLADTPGAGDAPFPDGEGEGCGPTDASGVGEAPPVFGVGDAAAGFSALVIQTRI